MRILSEDPVLAPVKIVVGVNELMISLTSEHMSVSLRLRTKGDACRPQ